MKVTNYNKIKKIHIDFPELMNEKAEKSIIELHDKILELKDKAADLRVEATEVDKQREALEEQWNKILPLITIEYKEKEIEEKPVDPAYGVMFTFSSDINKGIH